MLKKMCFLVFITTILFNVKIIFADKVSLPLFGKIIYLDPGHGGLDPGAIYGGIKEKDINLEITKKLRNKLLKLGAIVYLTRDGDYDLSRIHTSSRKKSDLSRRANIINESNCDLFLSIHLNAEITNSYKGAQVFYSTKNSKNKAIATIFDKILKKRLTTKRKMKKIKDLYLQSRIKRPGVLLELGFMSNPNERYLLKKDSYQDKLVNAIIESTLIYFKKTNIVL